MTDERLEPAAVVLVRPQEEGNVGAVARAMANMGLERLLLVAPEARIGRRAHALAVGARAVLDGAAVLDTLEEALAPFRRIVGTTSARGRRQRAIAPRELAAELAAEPTASTALLFGPESSGLTADELARCGWIVQVPCAPRQPTLNLAQAVLIVAYELRLARQPRSPSAAVDPRAPAGEVEALFDQLRPVLGATGFARDDTFEGVLLDLRRLAARAGLSPREVAILRGICRRAGHRLGVEDE